MERKVFSLKYRPKTFDEICVQEVVVKTLKNAILSNKIHNAYLFSGPRGTGKTTTARIFAKALNCEEGMTINPCNRCKICKEIDNSNSLDVIEIDGASNRGIDEIRELREKAKFNPIKGRFKIYIIDEVHMLTTEAFNALLKILEEPPPYVKFIFATTNPTKVPKTIISRCQRFDFRKATVNEIVARLKTIAQKENIILEEDAYYQIAKRADGAIRDAEVILEQVSVFASQPIKGEDVEKLLGVVPERVIFEYFEELKKADIKEVLKFLVRIEQEGRDPFEFYKSIVQAFRTILLIKNELPKKALGITEEEYQEFTQIGNLFSDQEIYEMINILIGYERLLKYTSFPEIVLENLSLSLLKYFKLKKEMGLISLGKIYSISPKIAGILEDTIIKEIDNIVNIYYQPFKGKLTLLQEHEEEIKEVLQKILNKEIMIKFIQREIKEEKKISEILDKTFEGFEELA
ncbi:MAG: DNA polymerase III subunit gamma/tau [candidate division WOR-3 bacterium]